MYEVYVYDIGIHSFLVNILYSRALCGCRVKPCTFGCRIADWTINP